VGNVHVVGGGGEILKLLAGEDIGGNQVNLGVTVLSSLGGRHVNDLARAVLDHNVAVLAQSRTLHGEGQRGSGISGLEGDIVLYWNMLAGASRSDHMAGLRVQHGLVPSRRGGAACGAGTEVLQPLGELGFVREKYIPPRQTW
jgi:hypothetical protein